MAPFTRIPNRFVTTGLSLNAPGDLMPPGKFKRITNMRSYEEGTLEVRPGTDLVTTLPASVHSIFRLNDPTPLNGGIPNLRVFGAGGGLYACPVAGPYPPTLRVSGFSGDPLTGVPITPAGSAQPYLYVVDSAKMGKLRVQGDFFPIGITAPTVAPSATLQPLGVNIIENFSGAFIPWVEINATGFLAPIFRINTNTVDPVLYDTGAAPSYASIVPALMDGINENALVTLGDVETVPVTETTIAIADTTIAAIIYDSGTTGLCTIQPAGSLGTGRILGPSVADVLQRYGAAFVVPPGTEQAPIGTPAPPGVYPNPVISQVDFPVNALVRIGGTELVRILSVALGKDGVQSFRCSTTSPHAVNETLQGVSAFRAYVNGTYGSGVKITDGGLAFSLFPTNGGDPNAVPQATGGMRTGAGWTPRNLALINGRATLPDDYLHVSVLSSDCPNLRTVRVYLSMEPTAGTAPSPADFTSNYFFFEWGQSDIAAATQAQNADPVASIQSVRQTVVANAALNAPNATLPNGGLSDPSIIQLEALGSNQWIDLKCHIKDLIRIGTDAGTSLSRITAAEIIVNVTNNPNQVRFDALWISGGYEPDLVTGDPYVWSYRYRSSITGARSNPSPPIRGGTIPHRQGVQLLGASSGDAQVDLVDWFRFGGSLTAWTYVDSSPNTSPTLLDNVRDPTIEGGETLDFDVYQPWPSTGPDASGTVMVAGTAVRRLTGTAFDTRWVPGTTIRINGTPYQLYAQPPNGDFLEIIQNAGAFASTSFKVEAPTILGSKQPTLSEDFLGFHFSVGDPANPGRLRWTTGNDPDATTLANYLDVTSAAEPLMNVFVWDGVPFVWSTENLYRIEPDFNNPNMFRAYLTPCGRGLWARWAFCETPQGVAFLGKDGIYLTSGGAPAVSITNVDLYRIFPHDGVDGITVNGYKPPNMADPPGLRLAYVDGYLYFDYAVSA